jgi:hypothetical protein
MIPMPPDSTASVAMRERALKLIQNKWGSETVMALPRACACVATVYRGLIVAESLVHFPHHALFAAAICADVANDRGFGAAHSASDFAAGDFARSTGDLPPALGSVRPA